MPKKEQFGAFLAANQELSRIFEKKMDRAQRDQFESLLANNKELSKIFVVGQSFSKLITKEDYEQLAAGRVCKVWAETPRGLICVEWED